MKQLTHRTILLTTFLVVLPFAAVKACGPFWEPDVFVSRTFPDDPKQFAKGRLGILQPGYDSNELAVAYRYLNGGRLSATEQAAYLGKQAVKQDWQKLSSYEIEAERKAQEAARPVNRWRTARDAYAAPPTGAQVGKDYGEWDRDFEFENHRCPDQAFEVAVETVRNRVRVWGEKSPWLLDWILGQDAVFSNCAAGQTSAMPKSAPAEAPLLLRADRAYQLAAAAFYAGDFVHAREGFEAIARDNNSPWHKIAPYLVARVLVRQAFVLAPKTDSWSNELAAYDGKTMDDAQMLLESLLKQANPAPSRHAVEAELNFVRIRTEPEERVAEICAALAGPGEDPNFAQDLKDLNFVLVKNLSFESTPPLLDWIHELRISSNGAPSATFWRQSHSLPWLLSALMKAKPGDATLPELLSAAASIDPASPAYDTATYERIRLLTELHRTDEARALVDGLLPAVYATPLTSRSNAFLAQRMVLARTFEEFLQFAPRSVLTADSAGADQARSDCTTDSAQKRRVEPCMPDDHSLEFDEDTVRILNRDFPMALLVKAATAPQLPAHLRQQVALTAWTRSVVLDDSASAAKLAPLLPAELRTAARSGLGFPAIFLLLHNPGLRPYFEPGYPHIVRYGERNLYRNNWWCGDWYGQFEEDPWMQAEKSAAPAFISTEEHAQATAEFHRLMNLPCAPVYLGRRVLDYAKAHPDDANVPEALALTVRATRYACLDWGYHTAQQNDDLAEQNGTDNSVVSKAAFQLLHRRYPTSPWAAKTRFYY